MGAADTNVLVRLLVADGPEQTERASAFLEARGLLWVSTSCNKKVPAAALI